MFKYRKILITFIVLYSRRITLYNVTLYKYIFDHVDKFSNYLSSIMMKL